MQCWCALDAYTEESGCASAAVDTAPHSSRAHNSSNRQSSRYVARKSIVRKLRSPEAHLLCCTGTRHNWNTVVVLALT